MMLADLWGVTLNRKLSFGAPRMKSIANIFLNGLLVVLPIFITLGIVYWLFVSAEQLLRVPMEAILPQGWYRPGMGLLGTVGIIFLCGLLVRNFLTQHLFYLLEWLLGKIPIVKTFYGSARDLMRFAFEKKEGEMRKVVSVEVKEGIQMLGFITNENPSLFESASLIAVYFPMSYQVGGFLAYMPAEKCKILDISVEVAMQQIFTANVVRSEN
jgi:uncharacterized membrane protein